MLTYTQQEDGNYVQSGSLPEGTKWATIEIAGRTPLRNVRRLNATREIVESAIASKKALAAYYIIRPANAPRAMTDEAREKLAALAAERKKNFERENREAAVEYKARRKKTKETTEPYVELKVT